MNSYRKQNKTLNVDKNRSLADCSSQYLPYMSVCLSVCMYVCITGVGSGGARGACAPPLFCLGGQWYVCAPPLFTPHFNFSLELYVYIKMTNNYLAFFIYQLIILWTITINWHRWLLVNNHISKYNSFILVLYRRYINYVSVCPPTFWHLPTPLCMYVCM